MFKFALYVGGAYLIYYLVVIAIELIKTPKGSVKQESTTYRVTDEYGDVEDESEVVEDIEFSSQGQQAMEKKNV